MKKILSILSLLLCGTMTFAQVKIADGIANGTVKSAVSGQTVTLTATPADGYYLESIEAVKTVDASNASRTRADIPVGGDYTLTKTSTSADRSQAATYTLTLAEGYGAYVTATFAARTAITASQVSLSALSFVYNGSNQKPTVTVTGLTEGTNYTVSYSETSWKDAGTYTVTVTGIDTYKGTPSKTWTISAAGGSLTAPKAVSNLVYSGKAQALISAGSSTTGTVKYSLDNKTYSTDIPQGTDAKEYTVYYKLEADKNHNDVAAASLKVSIAPKTVSAPTITLGETSFVYDGNEKKPTVTVKDGNTVIPAAEYSVGYTNNVNVGTATVTVTDVEGGNYTVSGSTTFKIFLKGDINGDNVVNVADIVKAINNGKSQDDIKEIENIIMNE